MHMLYVPKKPPPQVRWWIWVTFDVHDVTVHWDGQPRHIKADATGSTPLVGMLLLDGYNLNIKVERGGLVAIGSRA